VGEQADLPSVTHSSTLDVLGFKLTVHVLTDGQRVFEDTDELRAMFAWLYGASDRDVARVTEIIDDKKESPRG